MPNVLESLFSAKTVTKQKVTQWVSLKEAAQILGVKIYSIRTLEWDNELGQRRTIGRKVYIQKDAVLAYKQRKNVTGGERIAVTRSEYGQRALDAIQLVADIVSADKEITNKVYLKQLDTMLNRYTAIAQEMIK